MNPHEPPFALKELKLEVTHRCLLQCVHCSSDASPSCGREMSKSECVRIINQAITIGVQEIVFSGGEPLIWPPIHEAIERSCQKGVRVIIYTSGNVPEFANTIQRLKHLGLHGCIFSLFGATASVHEKITRKRGSFDKTLEAIRCADSNQLHSEIHFVPFAHNFRELEGVAKLGGQYGVERVSVLRFVTQGRGYLYRKHQLSKLQNLELRRRILDLRQRGFRIRTGSPYNFLLLNEDAQCASGIDRLSVGPDLRIYPCDAFKQVKAEELVGSLEYSKLDAHSLSDCWVNSPFLLAVRDYLTSPFVEPCVSCSVLKKCLSGCLAQKVLANGSFEKCADPDCIYQP